MGRAGISFAAFAIGSLGQALCAANASPPEDPPVYSLVTARETQHADRRHMGCIGLEGRVICPQYRSASYDEAKTLSGPSIETRFSIATEVAERAGWYRPVLLVILNSPDLRRVVAAATADASGRACIPNADLDRLGWHPNAPGIESLQVGLCADLSALAALPLPEVQAVAVLSERDLKRELRRDRKRKR